MTSNSASNYLINIGREVILYLQGTPKVLDAIHSGEREGGGRPYILSLLGKVNSTNPQWPKRVPFGSAFWFPFPLSRSLNSQKLNTGRSSTKELSLQCSKALEHVYSLRYSNIPNFLTEYEKYFLWICCYFVFLW